MSRDDRMAAIQALQAARGDTTVITYLTSTRAGLESSMSLDVIPRIYRHLTEAAAAGASRNIDLFIHSNGGDGIVPWRLITLLREFADKVTVLVPHRAFSAATLTALGADEVVMHPMGMLGPTDPTVTGPFNPGDPNAQGQLLGVSVEDVAAYIALVKDDFGIGHEDELIQSLNSLTDKVHPLALGAVKRSSLQSQMMGRKLLGIRSDGAEKLADHKIDGVIKKLGSELFFHGHPINRQEARDDVGLDFVRDASSAEESAMWALYELYESEMKLETAFQPIEEALAITPVDPAPVPLMMNGQQLHPVPQLNVVSIDLDPCRMAVVESTTRCDFAFVKLNVTVARDLAGKTNANVSVVRQGWDSE